MCAIPQSSRMMVMFLAWAFQRARSASLSPWKASEADTAARRRISFFMGDFYSRKKAALGGTCLNLSPGGSPAFAGQGRNHAVLVSVSAEPLPLVTARCRHVVFLSQEHNELSPPQTKSRSRKRIVGPHHPRGTGNSS